MLKKYCHISLLLLSMLPVATYSQTGLATAATDSTHYIIGDYINLHLSIEADARYTVYFPVLSDSLDAVIELINKGNIDTVTEGHIKRYKRTLTFAIYQPGIFNIPGMPFWLQLPGDTNTVQILTNGLELQIDAPEVNTELDIYDIKSIWNYPITFREVMSYAQWFFYVLALSVIVWYIYRKWKRHEPLFTVTPKPVIPPHIEALERLKNLQLSQLWQTDRVKEYYSELTDILRTYVEKALYIQAVEMTSDEIIDAIRQTPLEYDKEQLLFILREVLSVADLVKFAKLLPLMDEHDRCFKYVRQFVEQTIPIEKEEVKA
ncbi:hypothetical protein FACS1894201_07210 [Bacteroidia bacterium]|nr:hypothetical protein FACS1894201_07210 [Bacteroidia bacterium]